MILVVIAVAFVAQKIFGGEAVTPRLVSSQPVAAIGSGEEAVAVAGDGTVLAWLTVSEDSDLPGLPLGSPPKGPRVQGPVLEQVRVLAAAPAALRPYLASTHFGESGVTVELTSGIELRFGSATDAARKWKAAAAVLADPSITALDYVNVLAPGRAVTGGSGHTLPPLE
ncbi:MAG TPA: cell division protein FtsQ/DivIB [Solirubrobacterales bacterium]|nr:cell division protein FtsQ/DivIB [Solirubrobacterales bacterium]